MKKIIVTSIIVCAVFFANAQTDKGNWMIGGNFSLNTTTNTTIGLSPNAGYFIANNFAIGGNLNFLYNKSGDIKSTVFGVGPFVRYYFGKKDVRPFGLAEYNFTSTNFKVNSISNTENGGDFFLGGGIAAFINSNVAIETIAGYTHTKIKNQEGDGGFALRIGFQIYLHPNKLISSFKNKN